jgi:hypothetical protein
MARSEFAANLFLSSPQTAGNGWYAKRPVAPKPPKPPRFDGLAVLALVLVVLVIEFLI